MNSRQASRGCLLKCLLLTLIAAAVGLPGREAASAADRPNVLFIAIDDLNDWIGCLGGHPQTLTPHMDSVANRGVLFTNAHCAAPLCNPSRAAIFSGRQPFHTGVYTNDRDLRKERPDLLFLPKAFERAGYRTYGTGKLLHRTSEGLWDEHFFTEQRWSPFTRQEVQYTEEELPSKGTDNPRHVVRFGPDRRDIVLPLNRMPSDRNPNGAEGESFDWGPLDIGDEQMGDGQVTTWAIERLKAHQRGQGAAPFFLAVGYYRPHIPLYAPARCFQQFPEAEMVLPKVLENDLDDLGETGKRWALEANTAGSHATVLKYGQWKAAVAAYLACVSFVDTQIGRLLDAIEETGNTDETIVVIWSDHGWHLGEKQHWGKWTGWERATRVPLIIAAGQKAFSQPLARRQTCAAPVSLIDLYPTLVDLCRLPAVDGLDGRSLAPLLRDPSRSNDRIVVTTFDQGNYSLQDARYRYIRYVDGSEELYDHKTDPNEWTNLAADPKWAQVKDKMKKNAPRLSST